MLGELQRTANALRWAAETAAIQPNPPVQRIGAHAPG
jgi:hypothetical protein